MAKADRDALPEHTADLVDLLHERLTGDSTFAGLVLEYGFDVEAKRWYSATLTELALLIGREPLEIVNVVTTVPKENGGPWDYRITVLTKSLVLVVSGAVAESYNSPGHPAVQAFSRSTLEHLEVTASRNNPFDGSRGWPGEVSVLGRYAGRSPGVVFTVKGADAAEALLESLRSDLG